MISALANILPKIIGGASHKGGVFSPSNGGGAGGGEFSYEPFQVQTAPASGIWEAFQVQTTPSSGVWEDLEVRA
jgi:hypothetical protein